MVLNVSMFFLGILRTIKRSIATWVTMIVGSFIHSGALQAIDSQSVVTMLPPGTVLNRTVTTPEQHLGWSIGQRHVRHHEVVSYARRLCEESDRLTWESYGQTHGMRPLGVVIASRPDRQSTLPSLIQQRQQWALGGASLRNDATTIVTSPPPSVAWLGYSIHGDESGAVNASMLMLYLLAAAEGPWIDAILDQHLVFLDPCLNPDGVDRFAQWVNDHRGLHPASDSQDIGHQQAWPRGRSNHYGFDLNRDWLPATQPESQGRLELFYQWLPNLVLDFHEMGTDQSLFFQPGRRRSRSPEEPRAGSRYHARLRAALCVDDGRGWTTLFHSREV